MLEGAERLGGIYDRDRHGEGQASREFGERVRVREREERRRDRIAPQPGAQEQFRADPGGRPCIAIGAAFIAGFPSGGVSR